jgi:hypothetical protein
MPYLAALVVCIALTVPLQIVGGTGLPTISSSSTDTRPITQMSCLDGSLQVEANGCLGG